jgi:hypothetical protein
MKNSYLKWYGLSVLHCTAVHCMCVEGVKVGRASRELSRFIHSIRLSINFSYHVPICRVQYITLLHMLWTALDFIALACPPFISSTLPYSTISSSTLTVEASLQRL